MDPELRVLFDRWVSILAKDERILAIWTFGSVGTDQADAYSDVDLVCAARDGDLMAVDSGLCSVFEVAGAETVLWWPRHIDPERVRGYSILQQTGGGLHQYDVFLMAHSAVFPLCGMPSAVILDRTGDLGASLQASAQPAQGVSADRLSWLIDEYWLCMYTNAKYFRRRHLPELLLTQRTLFDLHLEIVKAMNPDVDWSWWPRAVRQALSVTEWDDLQIYFGADTVESLAQALRKEMVVFGRDARTACERHGISYPGRLEECVTAHVSGSLV